MSDRVRTLVASSVTLGCAALTLACLVPPVPAGLRVGSDLSIRTVDAAIGARRGEGLLRNVAVDTAGRDAEEAYEQHWRFDDYDGGSHLLECTVAKTDYLRDVLSFGYRKGDIEEATRSGVAAKFEEALEEEGIKAWFDVDVSERGVQYHWRPLPSGTAPAKVEEVRDAMERVWDNLGEWYRESEIEAYRARGFLLEGRTLQIDYPAVVRRTRASTDDCFGALRDDALSRSYYKEQLLGMFVGFVQGVRYEVPPDSWRGMEIAGLWVPSEVLVHDHGDCDSKSVLFAALWSHWKDQSVIVVQVPGHALIGVRMTPRSGQVSLNINGVSYVLCEVAGPGRLPPGMHEVRPAGSYRYFTID